MKKLKAPDTGEKRGRLEGGAATDEVLASTKSVLRPNRAGGTRGVQQYFTPLEVAGWIAQVIGYTHRVFDPTAGNGALLSGFNESARIGVEIDADQVAAARKLERAYAAILGDFQHVYPLLRRLGIEFPTVVCNPPFGLDWEVPGLEVPKGSSTLLTFLMARELLADGGQGCLIAGATRFFDEVHPIAKGQFFGLVEIDRLFPGVELPCIIAFFSKGSPLSTSTADRAVRVHFSSCKDLDDQTRAALSKARADLFGYSHAPTDRELLTKLDAIRKEYARRRGRRLAGQKHTIELKGQRLRVSPSAFTAIALARYKQGSQHQWLSTFDKQPPTYFAMQSREWRKLLTISEEARSAIDRAISDNERVAVPLYEVTKAQRLGFLVDIDQIRCTKSDPERHFVAGESYPISCGTQVLSTHAERTRPTPDGPEVFQVVVERKAMEIKIGAERFDESTTDLEYILDHFAVPDPGEIATRFPEEIAEWERVLAEIEREIQEREPGFRIKTFQLRDMARLLFKRGGVIAWQQGLGKTLGLGLFVRALEKMGRLPDGCALFIMPQDLTDQFADEIRRFFGRELLFVTHLGDDVDHPRSRGPREVSAIEVRERVLGRRADLKAQHRGVHLAPRPPVWAATWFEALAINQRESEMLPAAAVYRQPLAAGDVPKGVIH